MRTLREVIAETTAALTTAGIDSPRLDARVLLAHVMQIETSQTFTRDDLPLPPHHEAELAKLVQRRMAREPVSRIFGKREFWGLEFNVTPATLDPRADTETLVSAVIDHSKRVALNNPRILDLGTGTGCILLSLLHALSGSSGIGVDISEAALHVAAGNASKLQLSHRASFARMSWADALAGPFDIVTSNPPYLSDDDMRNLSPEVRYDPTRALDGGGDGLDCYRAIVSDIKRLVRNPAVVALEVGAGQAEQVARLVAGAGLRVVEIRSDLSAIPRCVVAEI